MGQPPGWACKDLPVPFPSFPATGLTIPFTATYHPQYAPAGTVNATLVMPPTGGTASDSGSFCPLNINIPGYPPPSGDSFVSDSQATFDKNVTVDGVPCMQFSWSSSSQQSRTSASATYVVTPAGLPVTYSYGENNPMGGSGVSVAFDFQAAKLAPTAC
jgi:hypothetical protein